MRFIHLVTITTLVSLLAGCGGPSKVSVRPETLSSTHKIALIKVAEPAAYTGQDFGNPAMMFGGVGGAIAGGSSANAGKSLGQLATEANFKAGERFTQQLANKLKASGYQVNLITVEREEKHELLKTYGKVNASGADAILDVAIGSIGYATEHPMFSPHWRPASQVYVALVDSRNMNTIYTEKFMYGYHNPFLSGTDIDAPELYHFKDKDALFSDASKLVEGMQHSVDAVVNQVVTTLRK